MVEARNVEMQEVATSGEQMDLSEVKSTKNVPSNKSGRWWKNTQSARFSHIKKDKPLHSKWAVKMKKKAELENARKLQEEIRAQIAEEKAAKLTKRKEQEERRKANIAKSEVVQVIKNTEKLKRLKKKQLKNIKTMDTTDLVQRTVLNK